MRTHLPPLVIPGLRVVFVGTRPGGESLETGNYYAAASNSFYEDLHARGWTDRRLDPREFASLPEFGIGLDDVYDNPRSLRRRLEEAPPLAVCFNSRGALEAFHGGSVGMAWRGSEAMQMVSFRGVAIVWAVPDSSGLAAGFRIERRELLCRLRVRVAGLNTP